jgi:hypothetical protein
MDMQQINDYISSSHEKNHNPFESMILDQLKENIKLFSFGENEIAVLFSFRSHKNENLN